MTVAWLVANWSYIAAGFWVISEFLNQLPFVKSNSFLELIVSSLTSLFGGQAATPASPVTQSTGPSVATEFKK